MGLDVKKTRTTTTLSATVAANGSAVTTATVTGSVFSPTGEKLVDGADMLHQGNGVYALTIDKAELTAEGTYVADITATFAGQTVVDRYLFYLKDDAA